MNKKDCKKEVVKKEDKVKFTDKGNRLIEFTRVPNDERRKLKIDAYGYIL